MKNNRYVSLTRDTFLKGLEKPCLYNKTSDELYEVNDETWSFLLSCARGEALLYEGLDDNGFLDYCLEEGLLEITRFPNKKETFIPKSVLLPSLRYLEVQLTNRCNLHCRHCYLETRSEDLELELALKLLPQFAEIQGLRLLLTGGEPLLAPAFWKLNSVLDSYPYRTVLLSNATLIDRVIARKLKVTEVQVSLDGMETGHETLRGKGSYSLARNGVENLLDAGVPVSIATIIHKGNLGEFDGLQGLLESWGITEWNIDMPSVSGNLLNNRELLPGIAEAAPFFALATGGGKHEASGEYACGAHLAAVIPSGNLVKCGFFSGWSGGSLYRKELREAWADLEKLHLNALKCNCEYLADCRGGCRFRAETQTGDRLGTDMVQCYQYGVASSE